MKATKILKIILSLIFYFIFFVFPFLAIILSSYNLFDCKIAELDVCSNFLEYFGFEKTFLFLILGILITTFSLLSNIFEEKLSIISSIISSIFILILLAFILNFGKIEIEMKNFYGIDKIKVFINYEIIFFLLIISVIIDIIRKVLIFFMK